MGIDFQIALFDKVIEYYGKRSIAAKEVAKQLNVSKGSVYRRMRGETLLTPHEIVGLAAKHDIMIDKMVSKPNELAEYALRYFDQGSEKYNDYLDLIQDILDSLGRSHIESMIMSFRDFPILPALMVPDLVKFKLFTYSMYPWQHGFSGKPFSLSAKSKKREEKINNLASVYMNTASYELYSVGMYDKTLEEIEYAVADGRFKTKKDVLSLYESLETLTKYLIRAGLKGRKSIPGSLTSRGNTIKLYFAENPGLSTSIILRTIFFNQLIVPHDYPNLLSAKDNELVKVSLEKVQLAMRNSLRIHPPNGKETDAILEEIFRRIDESRKRISKMRV